MRRWWDDKRRLVVAVVAIGVAALVWVFALLSNDGVLVDLDIYSAYSRRIAEDELYRYLPGYHLPFTYPPFAALIFAPFSLLPVVAQIWTMTMVSVVCLFRVCALAWQAFVPTARFGSLAIAARR